MVEKQLALFIYICVMSSLFPFYSTQIVNPFHDLLISANHDKRERFQTLVKSLHPLLFLQCRISFGAIICSHLIFILSCKSFYVTDAKTAFKITRCLSNSERREKHLKIQVTMGRGHITFQIMEIIYTILYVLRICRK